MTLTDVFTNYVIFRVERILYRQLLDGAMSLVNGLIGQLRRDFICCEDLKRVNTVSSVDAF